MIINGWRIEVAAEPLVGRDGKPVDAKCVRQERRLILCPTLSVAQRESWCVWLEEYCAMEGRKFFAPTRGRYHDDALAEPDAHDLPKTVTTRIGKVRVRPSAIPLFRRIDGKVICVAFRVDWRRKLVLFGPDYIWRGRSYAIDDVRSSIACEIWKRKLKGKPMPWEPGGDQVA